MTQTGRGWDAEESAPGRVNLIGEHTDYNDGFVLPMPIPQRTRVKLRRVLGSGDPEVKVSSTVGTVPVSWPLGAERRLSAWSDYVAGVFVVARSEGFSVPCGVELFVDSAVPLGSGLSSSAALEVAVLRALRVAFEWSLSDLELARLAWRAEVEYVGAPVGVMDQLASSCGADGEALLVDCRDLSMQRVGLPPSCELAVVNSGVRHSNAGGGYAARRQECEQACELLGVSSLRDVQALESIPSLPSPLDRRVRHVVEENDRVLELVEALGAEDLEAAGVLLGQSHTSLRDCYEVSVPEVDALVEALDAQPGVYGARMTGGGFGGSVVALCDRGSARPAGLAAVETCAGKWEGPVPEVLVPAPASGASGSGRP